MEGSTGNSKNVPKKEYVPVWAELWAFGSTRCEPKSLQPACIKFSNFMPILGTLIVTTPTFITSG